MKDMPSYERGDVRIRYEEAGSGFPLLVTPGGGLNSRVSNWPTAVFNAMDIFSGMRGCRYGKLRQKTDSVLTVNRSCEDVIMRENHGRDLAPSGYTYNGTADEHHAP